MLRNNKLNNLFGCGEISLSNWVPNRINETSGKIELQLPGQNYTGEN